MRKIQLIVADAHPDYIGKGIVTIDKSLEKKLKIKDGDIMAIEGFKKTFAIVKTVPFIDLRLQKIRMDEFTKRNANVQIKDRPDKLIKASEILDDPVIQRAKRRLILGPVAAIIFFEQGALHEHARAA